MFLAAATLAFCCVAGCRALYVDGAAGCHDSAPGTLSSRGTGEQLTVLHGLSALLYEFVMIAAMLTFAVVAFQRDEDYAGLLQRLWMLVNTLWLVWAVVVVSARAAARPRRAAAR